MKISLSTHLAVLSALASTLVGSIPTDCHPSSMITNFGEIPPFWKLYHGLHSITQSSDKICLNGK